MYLIQIRYTRPLAEVEQQLEAHRAYLREAPEAAGILMTARHRDRSGGMVMMRADSLASVEAFVARDPYATAGVAAFEITACDVAQVAPGLEALKG